ncbi:glutathione S-transferase family protein [Rheinheimera marina]|uniref:Glutathione S-transferase family protein n=1 Tax=Rheinheimera marina TaxID=1774958 RepID=A0ABV9JQN1_9GAMM
MQLFGSVASPYVRRLRLLLATQPYEFVALNIFESSGRATLVEHNPARKVPVLVDGGQHVFDSNVIYRYLVQKLNLAPLSWPEENTLTLINAVNDSLVELLLCQRSGLDTSEDKLFFNLQHERITACLDALNEQVKLGGFARWDYLAMSLYTLVDWLEFRKLADLKPYSALRQFVQQHQQQPAVAETDPRLS